MQSCIYMPPGLFVGILLDYRPQMPITRTPVRPRLTQGQRSAATRVRLLDATLDSLVDAGYAGTTTSRVCDLAGVSRGAQVHHYPTKAELVVAAVKHLAEKRLEDMQAKADELGEATDRIGASFDFLWDAFSGPLFLAVLELWVAARTDQELRARLLPVERRLGGRIIRYSLELAGVSGEDTALHEDLVRLSIHLMRGMALEKLLRSDDRERRRQFELWKRVVVAVVDGGAVRG